MEDSVPRTTEGAVLSIADKADSIAGMFALGLQPTGSKDPFALRRQANGIVKIIAEHKLPLSLTQLFEMRAKPIEERGGEEVSSRVRLRQNPCRTSSASAGVLSPRCSRLRVRRGERGARRRMPTTWSMRWHAQKR